MIFDTHAHYDDEAFDGDREEILGSLKQHNIGYVVNVGASLRGARESIALSSSYSRVYAAAGIHPDEVGCMNDDVMEELRTMCMLEKTVAVGEIGLDYYWDKEAYVQKQQRYWFRRQLELAREKELPVIIHSRDAAEDTMDILQELHKQGLNNPGVIHCYSYSPEMAHEFIKMGYYIGVGGVVTFKNAKKLVRTVEEIPMERILLETDCPYMAPEPHRGTRNDSRNIPYVIEKIAQIKGIDPKVVEETARENAFRLFTKVMR